METQWESIIEILKKREIGFYSNHDKACGLLFRSLVKDNNSKYECINKMSSANRIVVFESSIYHQNLTQCLAFHGQKKPTEKFSWVFPYKKLYDFCLVCTNNLSFSPIPRQNFTNAFYCLAQSSSDNIVGNILYIQDIENGKVMQEIFISSDSYRKFRCLEYEEEIHRLYIKSILNPKAINDEAVFSVIVFQLMPLEFMGFVDFSLEAFGKYVKQVEFNNELIFVLCGPTIDNLSAKIYNFDTILCKENKLFDLKLGQYCDALSGIAGIKPNGVIANYKAKIMPPVLYSVKCNSRSITFSSLPQVYFFSPAKQFGVFHVYDISTREQIGIIGNEKPIFGPICYLHEDENIIIDSSMKKIILQDFNQVYVYQIESANAVKSKKSLVLRYKLKFPSELESEERIHRTFPRLSSRRASQYINPDLQSKVAALQYDSFLEVLIVLVTIPSEAATGIVYIFDSDNGSLMSKFNTPMKVTEACMYDIYMYNDIIFITERSFNIYSRGMDRVFVFQMNRNDQIINVDDSCASSFLDSDSDSSLEYLP